MVKFRWEGDAGSVAGTATFFPESPFVIKVPLPNFAVAYALHAGFEAALKAEARKARTEMAAEITKKCGAV